MIEFGASYTERTPVLHNQEGASAGALRGGPLAKRVDDHEVVGPRPFRRFRQVVRAFAGSHVRRPVVR